jgi:hypothetical protein
MQTLVAPVEGETETSLKELLVGATGLALAPASEVPARRKSIAPMDA